MLYERAGCRRDFDDLWLDASGGRPYLWHLDELGVSTSCSNSVSGFSVNQLRVPEAGLTVGGNLKLILKNNDSGVYTQRINQINVTDAGTGRSVVISPIENVGSEGEKIFGFPNFEASEDCNSLEVKILYDRGKILDNQVATGIIRKNIRIKESFKNPYTGAPYFTTEIVSTNSPVESGDLVDVNFEIVNTGYKEGESNLEFYVDGNLEDSRNVDLGAEEEYSGTFSYDTSDLSPGTHVVKISTEDTHSSTAISVTEQTTFDLTANITHPNGSDFKKQAKVYLYSSNPSPIAQRSVSDGKAVFEVSNGDYTLKAVRDGYWNTTGNVAVSDSAETVKLIMEKKPVVEEFKVSDNSRCTNMVGWGFCAEYTIEYQIDWNVTDPSNTLNSAEILVDGNVVTTGREGSYTFSQTGSEGSAHEIKMNMSYSRINLCRNVTDQADGTGPESGQYSNC